MGVVKDPIRYHRSCPEEASHPAKPLLASVPSTPTPIPMRIPYAPPLPFPAVPALLSPDGSVRIHDGQGEGVYITGAGTRGRLEGCDVAGNKGYGVYISEGADPFLMDCR